MARRIRRRRRRRTFGEVTKRDFVAIAKILKDHGACTVSKDIARYFKEENPRFDTDRFLAATGCSR